MTDKSLVRQFAIVYVVLTIACILMLDYAVRHDIAGYGDFFYASKTIFGLYLDETGWIVFVSMVMSFICSSVAFMFGMIFVFIVEQIIRLVKYTIQKMKQKK